MSPDDPENPPSEFADRLRIALRSRGWSQKELAEALGLASATTVSHWLAGRRTPDAGRMAETANALNVEEEWLRGDGEDDAEAVLRRAIRTRPAPRSSAGAEQDPIPDAMISSARGLPADQAPDYARLMGFALLAAAWHSEHGWDVSLEVSLPDGRAVKVDGSHVSMTVGAQNADSSVRAAEAIGDAAEVSRRAQRRDSEQQSSVARPPRSA